MRNYILLAMSALLLLGCGVSPVKEDNDRFSQYDAVVGLRKEARQFSDQGLFDSAAASLERALRIDPQNAVLWFDLAKINSQKNNPVSARNLALRAIRFSQSASLTRQIEDFISAL